MSPLKMNFALIWSLVIAFCGVKAAPVQSEEITATEGDNVTLASGVDIGIGLHILTDDNKAVLLNLEDGLVSVQNNRIYWDSGTRSIILTSAQMKDSKTYHLQTFPNNKENIVTIKLNVTERLQKVPEDPSPGATSGSISAQQIERGRVGVYISLGLILGLLFSP